MAMIGWWVFSLEVGLLRVPPPLVIHLQDACARHPSVASALTCGGPVSLWLQGDESAEPGLHPGAEVWLRVARHRHAGRRDEHDGLARVFGAGDFTSHPGEARTPS